MREELRRQIALAQQGDPAALDRLTRSNLPLVHSIVRRFAGRGEPEDLFQLGCIGLIKAIRDFDLTRPVEFSTYAVPKIAGEMRRFLRDDGPIKVSRTVKEHAAAVQRAKQALCAETGESPRLSQLCQATGLTLEEVLEALQAPSECQSLEETVREDGAPLLELLPGESPEAALAERLDVRQAVALLEPLQRQVILLRYLRDLTQQNTARILGVTQVQVSRLEKRAMARLRETLA